MFGLGGLGFNALQIIRAINAKVLVSDMKQENLDEAFRIGVQQEDIVPIRKGIQEWVKEKGWTGKIDVVADFVGTKQTFEDAQYIGVCSINVCMLMENAYFWQCDKGEECFALAH